MIVTVFRSRLRDDAQPAYAGTAARMAELACQMPGYVSHKTFTADDGERVTLVEFADQASHDAWARHPEHGVAKRAGREHYYAEYRVQVCQLLRVRSFPAPADAPDQGS